MSKNIISNKKWTKLFTKKELEAPPNRNAKYFLTKFCCQPKLVSKNDVADSLGNSKEMDFEELHAVHFQSSRFWYPFVENLDNVNHQLVTFERD